jgi:hypothetical protein
MIRVGDWYDYLICDLTMKITGPNQKLIDMFRVAMGEREKGEPFDLEYRYKIEAGSLIAKETKTKFGMKNINIGKCKIEDTPLNENINKGSVGARQYLMMGEQGITKELMYHKDGIEGYEELVEAADDCKNEIIRGAMEILSSEGKDLELNSIEWQIRKVMDAVMENYHTNYPYLKAISNIYKKE